MTSCKVLCLCVGSFRGASTSTKKKNRPTTLACAIFSFSPFLVSVSVKITFSEETSQTHQQQDVHGEQIEAEEQRRALSRAEGRPEHPHQTRASSPTLRRDTGRGMEVRRSSSVFIIMAICSDEPPWHIGAETHPSDGSPCRLDEDGRL